MADGFIQIDLTIGGVPKAKSEISGIERLGRSAFTKVGTAARAIGTAAIAGTSAAIGAVAKITKSATDAYASYEQLSGGVETLFKKSAPTVEKYAQDAYKTANMSANEYMDSVTSFSASMISSLGGDTAKAAELSNQAITDMSDNSNKMGTNMEDIQNAYQGFAKQNYTMLDNLKLGYGGTKSEMERLLSDASKLTGKKYDVSNFADVTEAIHEIQTQWDITGTTSKEAATTIEGSVKTMKSSWTNWLTELGKDDANMGKRTKELITSVQTVAKNIVPRIGTILGTIIKYGPDMVSDLIGSIQKAAKKGDWEKTGAHLLKQLAKAISDADMPGKVHDILEDMRNAFEKKKNASPLAKAAAKLAETIMDEMGRFLGDSNNWENIATIIGTMLNSLVDSAWNQSFGSWTGQYLNDGEFTTENPSESRHAAGGVYNRASLLGIDTSGTRHIVGEAGREAVTPLNDAYYREVAKGIIKNGGAQKGIDYNELASAMCKVRMSVSVSDIDSAMGRRQAMSDRGLATV